MAKKKKPRPTNPDEFGVVRRFATAPGRTMNTFATKLTKGPAGLDERQKKDPSSVLTDKEMDALTAPGFFAKKRKKNKKSK